MIKNIITYVLITPYGDKYELDNRGYVIKYSNGLDKSNAGLADLMSWQVKGIRKIDNFGNLGHLIRLDEINGKELLYKNGTPMFTIEDLDHGTTRIYGNHKVHGVKSFFRI